ERGLRRGGAASRATPSQADVLATCRGRPPCLPRGKDSRVRNHPGGQARGPAPTRPRSPPGLTLGSPGPLEYRGDALAAADAKGYEAALLLAPRQLVHELDGE